MPFVSLVENYIFLKVRLKYENSPHKQKKHCQLNVPSTELCSPFTGPATLHCKHFLLTCMSPRLTLEIMLTQFVISQCLAYQHKTDYRRNVYFLPHRYFLQWEKAVILLSVIKYIQKSIQVSIAILKIPKMVT